ncbi:multidrug ABC transporter substrate-binding protein [Candidatus Saccharibacteria bacterium HGW-Saccharibacteria-1]|nr:MAG: multidrug ABC transporter substrate-binding protein [Candidatus Saccharibacteria bacterium HGW-Saccharibacteria-1]
MNVVSRGIKNALRSPMRSGAIVLMLAISIGLILSMLVARSSVNAKITEVKSSAGTSVTISPAGVHGFDGGGDPLTAAQITTIKDTAHVSSIVATLSDQLTTSDTSLTPSLELGLFGARQQRSSTDSTSSTDSNAAAPADSSSTETTTTRQAPTPKTTVTGTTDQNSVSTDGSDLVLSSGSSIDGSSSDLVALVGTSLATKNSLKVGSTFTAYDKTITVKGIFKTGNTFADSGLIMPLATVQTLTDQSGAVNSVIAKVDSSDNVSSTVTTLKSSLGDKADITSQVEQAAASVSSLESISSLALAGVVGATIAGSVIVLLAMVMIVRERRREIGVIKAIGGSNVKVIGQFVSEALTLTIIGAIVGLSLGIVVSGPMTSSLVSNQSSTATTQAGPGAGGPGRMFKGGMSQLSSNITQVTGSLTPQVFAAAVGITLIISIIGSAVPAWFIARIRPGEVLRTE